MTGALLLVTDLLFTDTTVVIATTALAAMTCVLSWCLAPLRRRAKVRRGGCGAGTTPGQGAERYRGKVADT